MGSLEGDRRKGNICQLAHTQSALGDGKLWVWTSWASLGHFLPGDSARVPQHPHTPVSSSAAGKAGFSVSSLSPQLSGQEPVCHVTQKVWEKGW